LTRPDSAEYTSQIDESDHISPMLHKMAKRIGAVVQEVKASHAVFMTQPKTVAAVIDRATQDVARKDAEAEARYRREKRSLRSFNPSDRYYVLWVAPGAWRCRQ
jgi:hypothetical protein